MYWKSLDGWKESHLFAKIGAIKSASHWCKEKQALYCSKHVSKLKKWAESKASREVANLTVLYVHSHEKRISAMFFPNAKYKDLCATINP